MEEVRVLVMVEALEETAAQVRCQVFLEAEVEEAPAQILEDKLQEVLAQRILVVVLAALAARLEYELPVSFLIVKWPDLPEVLQCLGHGLGPTVVAWGGQLQEPEQQRLHHQLNSSSRKYNSDNHHLNSSSRKYNNSDNYYQHRL